MAECADGDGDGAPRAAVVRLAGRPVLLGLGDPAGVALLLEDKPAVDVDENPVDDVERAMLPRGTWPLLSEPVRERMTHGRPWDWMWCTSEPSDRPGEDRVEVLGSGSGAAAVAREVIARGYPERGADEEDLRLTWWGYRSDAGLVGVLAVRADDHGAHLSAVTVDPAWRRRGVATAVTAAATRWGVRTRGVAHLGIWADNDAARQLYARLGYEVGAELDNVHR